MAKKKLSRKQLIITLGGLVVVAAIVAVVMITRPNPKTAATTVVPKGPESKQVTAPSTPSSSPTSPSTNSTDQTPPTDQSQAGVSLSSPNGTSLNRTVSKAGSGSNSPNLATNCQTLAGATCVVQLTMGSENKTVQPDYSDGQGGYTFDWSVQSYDAGTWQVALIATKNGQTSSSNIGPLVVNP